MSSRAVLVPLAVLTSLVLGVLAVAAPASAAVLPSGQQISVVQNVRIEDGGGTQQWNVDPATVVGTAVGSNAGHFPITGIDVDDDGHGFALSRTDPGDEARPSTISTFDANTGAYGPEVQLDFEEYTDFAVCTGLDYQPGQYPIVSCKWDGGTFIVRVDPVTGDYVGDDALWFQNGPVEVDSIAQQPGTSILWVFYTVFTDGVEHFVAPLDLATNELLLDDELPLTQEVRGADFASDGQLFASVLAGEDDVPSLATVNLTNGEISEVGEFPFAVDGEGVDSNVSSLTVWGKPALAATGSPVDVLPIGLGAALLLLAGAAFIATQRIGRKAN